ncbi:MAG: hypothetical protein DRJ05_07760 [Bacteroidetes bacterium]|nr:MAG: hypothetical protein DRJ05_07760 [Bacteroidota bacterium]
MNRFKKLFGKLDPENEKSNSIRPDFTKLINSSELNKSIIELDDYICELCDYGEKMDNLTEPQKIYFYIQNLEREVNNGGFNQFYLNSSGDFAHETLGSLKIIGANITAEIVKKANDQFPDFKVPKKRIERQEVLEMIEDKAKETWEVLDQEFFEYKDDLNSLNMDFVKINVVEF